MKLRLYYLFLIVSALIIFACNTDEKKDDTSDSLKLNQKDSIKIKNDTLHKNVKDTLKSEKKTVVLNNSKFICPQSDKEGNSDKFGTCPACGMELIENPDYTPVKPK
jgi:hypothetical protein